MKKLIFFAIFSLLLVNEVLAEKIAIVYTGQTHATLYHCDCPKEPDGGLARRMTKINELRALNPNTIVVDSGGFFAGGIFDENSLNIELDTIRNNVNLEALKIIGYDAFNVGDDEFNFGKSYLVDKIREFKTPFLSVNLKIDNIYPYIIKKLNNGKNVAIIGLTNDEARVKSGGSLTEESVFEVLRKVVSETRKKADLVVVLSYLDEQKNVTLASEVNGIDIIVSGRSLDSSEAFLQIGSTILVRPVWQGRRLGKIDLELEGSKIKNFKVEQIRLSDKVFDSPAILKILPKCFSDSDCRKSGVAGFCSNPGRLNASCSYNKPKSIKLTVIDRLKRRAPNQKKTIEYFKTLFPGLEVKFLDYESKEGVSLINKIQAKLLPIYLLGSDAKSEKSFENISKFVELKEGYCYLIPEFSGGSFFVGRKKIKNRLDVFIGTRDKNLEKILSVLNKLKIRHKELSVGIHYLAIEGKEGFTAPNGISEVEEVLRQVCIGRLYGDKFWDYILCRAGAQESSWWDICAEKFSIDTARVRKCSTSNEGIEYLRENTGLNKELGIAVGPTYLANNQDVFAFSDIPKVEDLEKMIFN